MAGADRPGNDGRAFGVARCGPFSQHRAELGPRPSVVVLAVDAASDAGRQDAAAAGQQPGPLGRALRATDQGTWFTSILSARSWFSVPIPAHISNGKVWATQTRK